MENKAPFTCIMGATSSLAVVLARKLAADGRNLLLVARDREALDVMKADINVRFDVDVEICVVDLLNPVWDVQNFASDYASYCNALYMVAGNMGNDDVFDVENTQQVTDINYTIPAKIIGLFAREMQQKKTGEIIVISSVAGDRGRQSNYVYGAAKAALTAYASGLRNRLCKDGVHVMTVKPGFIDTPMTYAMDSPLICPREVVADRIIACARKRKDTIYAPWFWRYIMLIICSIPEKIFKRLSL